jgi:two-component system, OmpR family, response regulator
MSVTALRPIARPVPWAPDRRPRTWPTTEPAPLTVRIEITLDGESQHRDAAEVLDTLRTLANRLGPGRVTVRPDLGGEPGPQLSTVDTAPSAEVTAEPESPRTVVIGAGSRVVTAHGRTIEFTRVEYDLLLFFARNPRRVFTRPQLLQLVWGLSHAGERTVDVHIRRLRAKLGDVPLVTTVRGVGYRLADDADLRVLDR